MRRLQQGTCQRRIRVVPSLRALFRTKGCPFISARFRGTTNAMCTKTTFAEPRYPGSNSVRSTFQLTTRSTTRSLRTESEATAGHRSHVPLS